MVGRGNMVLTLKKILALLLSVTWGICAGFSMDYKPEAGELTITERHYPVCVGTKLFTNLTAVLPYAAEDGIHEAFTAFNQQVTSILTKRDVEGGREAFQRNAENTVAIIERIRAEGLFSGKPQIIAAAMEADLKEFVDKARSLESWAEVKGLVESCMPTIAAEEFLARYKDVKENSIHCEDCGCGYLTSCKSLSGKSSFKCRLCNHHQESPFQVAVRLVY